MKLRSPSLVYDCSGPSGLAGTFTVIGAIRSWTIGAGEALAARPRRVRAGIEAALALVLIVQLGRLAWILIEPIEAPSAPTAGSRAAPAVDYSVFQRFDAFFRNGAGTSGAEQGEGGGQFRLFGLRSDGAGGGSAIIGLADGRQVSIAVGEAVEPGVILQSVGADHVVLARGSSQTRLAFGETASGAPPPPPPPATPQTVTPQPASPAAAPAAADPARLIASGLRPRMQGVRLNGFTIAADADASALEAAGLAAGDVILAVNGQPLDRPDRIAALRSQLTDAASAEIRFERDGEVRTTTIRTGH